MSRKNWRDKKNRQVQVDIQVLPAHDGTVLLTINPAVPTVKLGEKEWLEFANAILNAGQAAQALKASDK